MNSFKQWSKSITSADYHNQYVNGMFVKFDDEINDSHEEKEEEMTKSITKTKVNSTSPASKEFEMEKMMRQVSTDVSKSVLNIVLTELEIKSIQMLEKVEELSRPKEIIVGITLNDKELGPTAKEPHPKLPDVINMLANGLTPLLVGPAGSGKTFLAEQASEALKLPYGHLCFSAGVSETWLFGRQTPIGFINAEFSNLYESGGLFLADEMDAADANLLLTINTALANGHLYNPISGRAIKRHKDFHFIGTANTFGKGGNSVYTGRSRLDAATLDRFTCVEIDYLESIENVLCPNKPGAEWLRKVRSYIKSQNSNEIVSYRAFEKAYKLNRMGYTSKQMIPILFASWPDTLKNNCPGNEKKI